MTVPIPEATLQDLERRNVVARLWQRDHTIWKPDPTEITNRLGWLTVADEMQSNLPALEAFFHEVRDAGYRDIVLLGMGGSSLGAEVLRCSLPPREGAPRLSVLDSTVPGWVHGVEQSIDLKTTLFLVSSKSGGTVETLSLYRYFRTRVEATVGMEEAGSHFVAITDADTSLHRTATETGFRRAFLNPPDVGGRYSVLSYFGLVPSALAGLDVAAVVERARSMAQRCGPDVPLRENPGALLGAALGAHVLAGRDKATIVASPAIRTFGLWAEQLLGESTGKEATGIVPIADEPLAPSDAYTDDRLFVYLRLEGDDNAITDAALAAIEAAGHPVQRLDLSDPKDLAAEFFRWEFATAVAGSLLGINPFDQPNVQQAKEATAQVLRDYEATSTLPTIASSASLPDLLASKLDVLLYRRKLRDYIDLTAIDAQSPYSLEDGLLLHMARYGATPEGFELSRIISLLEDPGHLDADPKFAKERDEILDYLKNRAPALRRHLHHQILGNADAARCKPLDRPDEAGLTAGFKQVLQDTGGLNP